MSTEQPTVTLRQVAETLGVSIRAVQKRARSEAWHEHSAPSDSRAKCMLVASLPEPIQVALRVASNVTLGDEDESRFAPAWDRFNGSSELLRRVAHRRVSALREVASLCRKGKTVSEARREVADRLTQENVRGASVATLIRWTSTVDGTPMKHWPALLLPVKPGKARERASCESTCWEWYKGHYLTRSRPSHAETYRRVRELAKANGWSVPSARTLRRRIDAEVSRNVQIAMREGTRGLRGTLPTRERDASVFACGQAVNGDGLKFDRLWVRFPDGEVINSATGWFWQDIRSRRILAWRLDKTENTDLFRLATYDLTGICAPEHVYLDNTRVAANKVMTAGAKSRHRFKRKPEDGKGLLERLGMEVHFTNPDSESGNPGAKPIERAFGIGGLHDKVATNPKIDGKGFSKATAIDFALLQEVVAIEVARHNAQDGRRTKDCGGILSFDDAWRDGLSERPPRVYSSAQRQLMLLSLELVTIKQNGMIVLDAGKSRYGRNSYWCEQSCNLAGHRVAAHFDPGNLSAGIHVYSLEGEYLFPVDHLPGAAFNDSESARQDGKWRRRQIKATKKAGEAAALIDAQEREKLYSTALKATQSTKEGPPAASSVVAAHFQRPIDPIRDAVRAKQRPADRDGSESPKHVVDLDAYLKRIQEQQIEQNAWRYVHDQK